MFQLVSFFEIEKQTQTTGSFYSLDSKVFGLVGLNFNPYFFSFALILRINIHRMLRQKPKIVNDSPRLIKVELSRIAPIKIRRRPRIAKYIGGAFNPYFLTKFKNPNGILFPYNIPF
jgi:hypothetical protein